MTISRVIIKGYRIFEDFEFSPQSQINLLVGDNESGKSSLLEAIALVLTGRVNGRWAQDELNPYWFNRGKVNTYFDELASGANAQMPEILIEVYFTADTPGVGEMIGVHNTLKESLSGMKMHIAPNSAYAQELKDFFEADDVPRIIPVEWYAIEWSDFSDKTLVRRPRQLGVSIIDSRTVRSTSGVDYHTRDMFSNFVMADERAAVAVANRKARHNITLKTLGPANERIAVESHALHDKAITLQMDQSSSASWEAGIVPEVDSVPFAMAGQGQQASIKIALAMHRSAEVTAYALIEEPENHLSYTSLIMLVARIEALGGDRQLFITTHSSYVLNRLGLDKLTMMHDGRSVAFSNLPKGTVKYFQKLSGYDTLRIVLAKKAVLVEGPTDEMVFSSAYAKTHGGKQPMEDGIDVISMAGLALKRGLQLGAALDRRMAAVRDNDGRDPSHWITPLSSWTKAGVREVFIGEPQLGRTLEPQFAQVNTEDILRRNLSIPEEAEVEEWLTDHKTEWGFRVSLKPDAFTYPKYILDAIVFLS
ncbi:ATP-dependent nuclease [Clavibacter michiganensis]|uniref:ATP-dependent nuclease n=1 Tax=Clavibacter michiganensis TaxID=28447 RepID=UPI00190F232E|nr:AAA family ATPase [Clavibacter michiganensis]